MFRIALVVWIMLGTALAGTAMLAVLILPDLSAQAMRNIPLAVLAGFAAAMPLISRGAENRRIAGSIIRKRTVSASLSSRDRMPHARQWN
jgi:hypothetical protein